MRIVLLFAALFAFGLAGCQLLFPPAGASPPPITAVGAPGGLGPVSPDQVVEATGGIAITGTVTGTASAAITSALVYFTDASDRFFAVRAGSESATLVTTKVDREGRFTSPAVFSGTAPVVANAFLSRSRRLAAFVPAGATFAKVSVGSTMVLEFLRDQATRRMIAFPDLLISAREVLAGQAERADALLASGALHQPDDGVPGDFLLGNGGKLAARYIAGALSQDRESFESWQGVLSPPVHAVTLFAGTSYTRYEDGSDTTPATSIGYLAPTAVVQGIPGDDAVYLADTDRLMRISGGFVKRFTGKAESEAWSPDGTTKDEVDLYNLLTVKIDSKGNFAFTFAGDETDGHFIGFLCMAAGSYYGRDMQAGTFYRLGAPDGQHGYVDGPLETARFREPYGVTFDDRDNLYVADRRNNRIRRIDKGSGAVTTVLGDGWPVPDAAQQATGFLPPAVFTLDELGATGTATVSVPLVGRLVDQAAAGSGSGRRASFGYPQELVWRKAGTTQELYVYDVANNAIRRAAVGYDEDFSNASVITVAGKVRTVTHPVHGYSVPIGESGPLSEGPGNQVTFGFSTIDPLDPLRNYTITFGGLALDARKGRLFILDMNNMALRMLDLGTGNVSTIALSDDSGQLEGDAMAAPFSQAMAGVTVLRDGSVLWVDEQRSTVSRIHLQFDP